MNDADPTPIRLAVVNDYEVVIQGLASMLHRYSDRIEIVEMNAQTEVSQPVDVVLYYPFGQPQANHECVTELLENPNIGKVCVYTWNFQPSLVENSIDRGVAGYLSKTLPASSLVQALERVTAGESVVSPPPGNGPIAGDWPGREEGLTPREAEMLALITQGLSNNTIAEQTHLSINSVKSYIRTAYRKIGVTSRSQAVLWGVRHGFEPDSRRIRPRAGDLEGAGAMR